MIYPWLKSYWQQLIPAVDANAIATALLLSGPAGIGKLDFARVYANRLLCEQPIDGYPCLCCRSCGLFAAGSHPDFFELTLLEKSQVIKIDQIRVLTDKLYQTAHTNRQIVLIHPAECLHFSSANALLKTLEEPAGQVIFILLTAHPEQLLPTVISRCQKLSVAAATDELMMAWFKAKHQLELNPVVLRAAQGSPLRALYLHNAQYLKLRDQVIEHLFSLAQGRAVAIAPVSQWLKQDLALIFQAMTLIACDCVRIKLAAGFDFLFNVDSVKPLQEIITPLSSSALTELYQQLLLATQQFNSATAVNSTLLLEKVLLSWQQLFSKEKVC